MTRFLTVCYHVFRCGLQAFGTVADGAIFSRYNAMKVLFQFFRILVFCLLGELLHAILPLPIPSSIYALLLLLTALNTGLVKLADVKQAGSFLSAILPLLFIPGTVGVMKLWDIIQQLWLPILIALLPITLLTFAASGWVTQGMMRRKKHD